MLAKLYAAIEKQQFDAAWQMLFECLNAFENKADFSQDYVINRADPAAVTAYQTLATHIQTLIAHKQSDLSVQQFYTIALHQANLQGIFDIAQDHTLMHLALQLETKIKQMKKNQLNQSKAFRTCLLKYALCLSLPMSKNFNFHLFSGAYRPYLYASILGLLGARCFIRSESFEQYHLLLEILKTFGDIDTASHLIPLLARVWYHLSYDSGEKKYHMMKHLNQVAKKWIAREGGKVFSTQLQERQDSEIIKNVSQITVLVVLEQFKSHHAMYRCFAPSVIQLREKFHLIGLCEEDCIDEKSASHFHEIIQFRPHVPTDFFQIVEIIREKKPTIIYFTSVGMQYWSWLLANMRLAPIQVVTPGHTGTTCTESIDYLLVHQDFYTDKTYTSEQVMVLPENRYFYVEPSNTIAIQPEIRKKPEPLTIAVLGNQVKLNPIFIGVCEEIQKRAKKPIVFSFFPYAMGLRYHQVKQALLERLHANVYPILDYPTYLNYLKLSDLCLGTFPFGGTNTTMDALKLCLPYVGFESDEITCSDPAFMRRVGLPRDLVAKNEKQYVEIALALIENDAWRLEIAYHLRDQSVSLSKLLQVSPQVSETDYSDVFMFLCRAHSVVKQSGKKVWFPIDRQ